MKPEETFAQYFHLLDDAVASSQVNQFSVFPCSPKVKGSRLTYADYQDALVRQIFLEIKTELTEKLKTPATGRLMFKTGSKVKNNNVRFFVDQRQLNGMTPGKYATLLKSADGAQQHVFIADYDGGHTFQVTFKLNPSIREVHKSGQLAGAYRGDILANLTPSLRQFTASQQSGTPLLKAVAAGEIGQWYLPGPQLAPAQAEGLNASQQQVLAGFTNLAEGVQLLMGPPGTGKTTTIVKLLAELQRCQVAQGTAKPIVVCGPSNQSVQVIAAKFHEKNPAINVALYANESRLDPRMSVELAGILAEQRGDELANADIIFMTLSAAGSKFVEKTIKKRGGAAAVVVDEAGQSAESETAIVFGLKPEKVLLVGDVNQLPPTVKINDAERFHYDESMMGRLIKRCEQRHFLLDTQYRMHPEISAFANEAFYGGQIHDGVTAEQRTRSDLVPYQVIDVDGCEAFDVVTKSYQNLKEAMVVVNIVKDALTKGYSPEDISIITPYKPQVELIKTILRQSGLNPDLLRINTVDSFQGSEGPVVLVSMVRANKLAKIGFLRRYERLNVAITRPQEVLRILINGNTFNPLQPRSEFEASFVEVMRSLQAVPLPEHEDPERTFSIMDENHGDTYSKAGYRPAIDYYEEIGWQDDYDDWQSYPAPFFRDDQVGELATRYFAGPEPMRRLFELLKHFKADCSAKLGKLPIFFTPNLPVATHVVQDILDRVKLWHKLNFAILPADVFKPIRYRVYNKRREKEWFVDTGYPFDADDNYCPGGYEFYNYLPTEQEDEIVQRSLVFDGHQFLKCDLQGVNFYNSEFLKTCFDGSDVRGCRINLDKMDADSRQSFESALAEAERLNGRIVAELLPTERLLIDAATRGVYVDNSSTLFQSEPTVEKGDNAAAPAPN